MASNPETRYRGQNVLAHNSPTFGFLGMTARARAWRRRIAAALVMAGTAASARHLNAAYAPLTTRPRLDFSTLLGPRLTSTMDWWSRDVATGKVFDLCLLSGGTTTRGTWSSDTIDQRRGFVDAWTFEDTPRWVSNLYWHVDVNEIPEFADSARVRVFLPQSSLSPIRQAFVPVLEARAAIALGLGPLLAAPRPEVAPVQARQACPYWRLPQPVHFVGLGGEGDRFTLVDCAGDVSADAMDRLSVMARLPGSARPSLPLPLTPRDDIQFEGEWVEGVHLLHPRLFELVERIALAFPRRTIALYSGYRRDRRPTSPHVRGRALDLAVENIPSETLFAFCRTLRNAGCGYYPNQPFVHVDVRNESQGSVAWVDVSQPGQASVYTEIWPKPESASASASPESE